MGTDNPKVSAYVPKALKDRLTKFREERNNMPESQAVTIILAEYFQMPEVLGRSPETGSVGGVTLARMEALEERLLDFTASVEYRLQALGEEIRKMTKIPIVHLMVLDDITSNGELQTTKEPTEQVDEVLTVDRRLELEPTAEGGQHDGLPSELPIEPSVKDAVDQESSLSSEPPQEQRIDTQANSLLSEPLEELLAQPDTGQVGEPSSVEESVNLTTGQDVSETIEVSTTNSELPKNSEEALPHHSGLPFELKSEPPIEFSPLNSVKLSRRLGKGDQSVKHMKRKHKDDIEGFAKWTQGEDPDKVAWEYTPKGYVPTGNLTEEQKAGLRKWYEENPS